MKAVNEQALTLSIERAATDVIRDNSQVAERYRSGHDGSLYELIGLVRRKVHGKSHPDIIAEVLKRQLRGAAPTDAD
jgi:Asp-tRNA(Asn)/Glu-tRNA(Gln) amidotransferase B subunit